MAASYRSTTQYHLDVEDVLNNLVLLKDGSCAMVLKTNAINFGLLSEEEQDATIYAYAAFLNSLTFSVQVLIRSSVKDISGYLRLLEEQETRQSNPVKKQQINGYKNFIRSLVTERNVLEKNFYIVIPFSYIELGISQSVATQLFSPNKKLPFDKTYIIEKAQSALEPRRDHVVRQLERIGLSARQLSSQELIQLLFSMYNPSSSQGQKINNASDYTVPLVQPAYIKPKEDFMTDQNQPNTTQPTPQSQPTPTTESTIAPQAPTPSPAPTLPQQPAPAPSVATNPAPTMQASQLAPDPNPTLSQPTAPEPVPSLDPVDTEPVAQPTPELPITQSTNEPTPPSPLTPSQPPITPPMPATAPQQSAPTMPTQPQTPAAPSAPSIPQAPTPPTTPADPQAAINSAASSLASVSTPATGEEQNQ